MAEYLIPHPNVPTTDIGSAKLKESVMLFNENFLALDMQARSNATKIDTVNSSKADAGHNHDKLYSELGHTHTLNEIDSLTENLEGKAPLVHTHEQYLTSLPQHMHEQSEINNLVPDLAQKADANHFHVIGEVAGLQSELSSKATQSQLTQVASMIPDGAAHFSGTQDGDLPLEVGIKPDEETSGQKNVRVGSSERFARADHKHVFPVSKNVSDLVEDGHGVSLASPTGAQLGEKDTFSRIDHSHPLNFPSSKGTGELKADGSGSGGNADFGDTGYYADLGHSHPLNVATDGSPADVVKNSGTASLGTAQTYAKTDHVHKLPTLSSSDITHNQSTVSAVLTDNESRIQALEARKEGAVSSVDGVSPGDNGDVQLNALTTDNYEETLDNAYQSKSSKLDALDDELNEDGTLPSSSVKDENCSSGGNCLAYFAPDKTLGHLSSGSHTATVANTDAVTSVFEYSGTGSNRTATLKCTAVGAVSAPTAQKVVGFTANSETASLVDAAVFDGSTLVEGDKFVKTTSDGKLKEDDFEGLSDNSDTPEDVGDEDAASVGSSDKAARADHVHALEALYEGEQAPNFLYTEEDPSASGVYYLYFHKLKFDKYGRYAGIDTNRIFLGTFYE